MLEWGMKLAVRDGVSIGLLCPEADVPFFQKHSFENVRDFQVPSDGLDREFTYKWCVLRKGTAGSKKPPHLQSQESKQGKNPVAHKKAQKNIPIEWDV